MTARYFAQYNDSGDLLAIGTGQGGTEITEAEYNTLLAEIRSKARLVAQLYAGEITIEDVPTEWREEIQRRVNERIAMDEAAKDQDISGKANASDLTAHTVNSTVHITAEERTKWNQAVTDVGNLSEEIANYKKAGIVVVQDGDTLTIGGVE